MAKQEKYDLNTAMQQMSKPPLFDFKSYKWIKIQKIFRNKTDGRVKKFRGNLRVKYENVQASEW